MRKKSVVIIIMIVLCFCTLLPACAFDRLIGIDKNSNVEWVQITLSNGRKYQLSQEQGDYLVQSIKDAGIFKTIDDYIPDKKYTLEYDYTLTLNVKRRQFLKTVDTHMTYCFGATVVYENEGAEPVYYPNVWVLNYSGTYVANTTEEYSNGIRAILDEVLMTDRQNHYDAIKSTFVDNGYDITEKTSQQLELEYLDKETGSNVNLTALNGFVATKQGSEEEFVIYRFMHQDEARIFAQNNADSMFNDVFVGIGYLEDYGILNGLL